VGPETEQAPGWLTEQEIGEARERLPIVYVEAVPVRVDHLGRVERVGLLLRSRPDGTISRAIVSGRVLYREPVRDALWRHLSKDLGAEAEPRLPASPTPLTVVEYFPEPSPSGYTDPRQHAVALVYLVPVDGRCAPSQDALDLAWVTPEEAVSDGVVGEMSGGQDRVVRLALAHAGCLR